MPTYIVLAKMTQQGAQSVKEIPQRRQRARDAAKELGITYRDGWLTMGEYDVVFVLDAPDGNTMAKFVMRIGMAGNLSTQTLRAFSESEADDIISGV
jgi:uncharacterized protein with GYD domain